MKRVIIICTPKLPKFWKHIKKSMLFNKQFDFLVLTKQAERELIECNVTITLFKEDVFLHRIMDLLDIDIHTAKQLPLHKTKVLWGDVFFNYIKDYEWFAWCDADVIFGELIKFYTDEMFEKNDIIAATPSNAVYSTFSFIQTKHKQLYKRVDNLYQQIDEQTIYTSIFKLIQTDNLKLCSKIVDSNNKITDFNRSGKRQISVIWDEGKLHASTYNLDYPGQRVFNGFYDETSLKHLKSSIVTLLNDKLRIFNKGVDCSILFHRNLCFESGRFTRSFCIDDKTTLNNLTLIDVPWDHKLFVKPNFLYIILSNLNDINALGKQNIIFRGKTTKKIITEVYSNDNILFYLKNVFTNLTLYTPDELDKKLIKQLYHVNKLKSNNWIELDILHIKNKLLNLKEEQEIPSHKRVLLHSFRDQHIHHTLRDYLIEQENFYEYDINTLTVSAQAKIFCSADVILVVTNHIILSNTIFCNPNTKVFYLTHTTRNVNIPNVNIPITTILPDNHFENGLYSYLHIPTFFCSIERLIFIIFNKNITNINHKYLLNDSKLIHAVIVCNKGFNDFISTITVALDKLNKIDDTEIKNIIFFSKSWSEFDDYFHVKGVCLIRSKEYYLHKILPGCLYQTSMGGGGGVSEIRYHLFHLQDWVKRIIYEKYKVLQGDYTAICFRCGDYLKESYKETIYEYGLQINQYKKKYKTILLATDDPNLIKQYVDNIQVFSFSFAQKLKATDIGLAIHEYTEDQLQQYKLTKQEVDISTLTDYYLMLNSTELIPAVVGNFSRSTHRFKHYLQSINYNTINFIEVR